MTTVLYSRFLALSSIMFVAIIVSQVRGQGADLHVKLEQGTEFTYTSQTVTFSKQAAAKIPGGAIAQTVEREMRIHFKVLETNFRLSSIEVTYERIWIKLDAPFPGLQLEYDSALAENDDAVENDLANTVRPFVGMTFTLIVGSTGTIEDATFPPGSRPEGNMGGVVLPLIDLAAIREELGPIFSLGAGREARAKDDQWTTTVKRSLDLGVDVVQETSYRVSNTESLDAIRIELEGTLSLQMQPGAQMARADVKKSTLTGVAVWNAQAGHLESYEMNSSLNMVAEPIPGTVFRLENKTQQRLERVE